MFPKPKPKAKKVAKPLQRYTALRPVRKGKDPRQPTLKSHRNKPSPPTAAQRRRITAIKERGCVACLMLGLSGCSEGLPDAHHLNEGGQAGRKRRGHDYTIALGKWHHVGTILPGETARSMEWKYGPSLARSSKDFRRTFGTDDQLLQYQNELLKGAK